MRKIIIGKERYDIIKYKSHLRKDEWANCLPCSIKIKMDYEDCQNLKFITDKFGDFNFESIEDDGVYICNAVLSNMIITSKLKNGEVICKMEIVIWTKEEMEESQALSLIRNLALEDVLSV